jgi:asparagine synthase (glutamine-hydrolysing)
MCGITGWVDFGRDLRNEQATIEAMTATMASRGPDAGGVWCSAHAVIGHRRLSVIDVPGGLQPMRAPGPDDVVLTFSGEIYNFTELRQELISYGHSFRTRSDTEVLLHSYLQWGHDCVQHLSGMFAFGLWDGRRQELLLARDRLGVKPLYYALRPQGVLFGSEPKAVLAHPEFRAEIDAEGLAELFSQIGAKTPGHGIYRGLAELRPGTLAVVGRGGTRTSVYWALGAAEHADGLVATARTVRELLTFSVDFSGSADSFQPDQLRPSHDEPYARAAAEHIGSRHTTIVLSADDLVTEQWAPLAAHDLPTGGDMWTSMYLLCREIRQQSTVALSGEAADEVFGGYPWYHVPALLAAPTFPWAASGSWEPLLQPSVRSHIRLAEYAADQYSQARGEVPQLAGEDPSERRIREVLYLGITRWLPFLLDRKDRLSMASGLEVRVPFCDHRLVEYVFNVPWALKEAGGIEKGLLRTAAAGLLPDDLIRRRKSMYPGAADPVYERAVDAQMRALLASPDAPLFTLISRERLAASYARDPRLPETMAVRPSATTPAAFLLDVNRWLARSGVTIR